MGSVLFQNFSQSGAWMDVRSRYILFRAARLVRVCWLLTATGTVGKSRTVSDELLQSPTSSDKDGKSRGRDSESASTFPDLTRNSRAKYPNAVRLDRRNWRETDGTGVELLGDTRRREGDKSWSDHTVHSPETVRPVRLSPARPEQSSIYPTHCTARTFLIWYHWTFRSVTPSKYFFKNALEFLRCTVYKSCNRSYIWRKPKFETVL